MDFFELVAVAVFGGDVLIRERLVVLGNEPLDVAHGHQGELLLLLERVVELNVAGNEGSAAAFLTTDHAEVILRAAMGNHDGRDSQQALLIAVLRLDVLAQALSAFQVLAAEHAAALVVTQEVIGVVVDVLLALLPVR